MGISKINVNTDLQLVFAEATNYTQKMEKSCILIQLLRKEQFITNMNLVLL